MALSPNFNLVEVDLVGKSLNNPTSLQFGPDGRLYVSQQNGLIRSYGLKAITDSDGKITKFVISNAGGADKNPLVQMIPNHDDDGDLNAAVSGRQVTGLVVEEGANGEVVLYVSSSDPRIGAGPSGEEANLDTNSGIISRLVKKNGTWEKVDLVIGLPRSEENHSTNGLDIRTEMVNGEPHKIMYVASGGNTNRGAPSNNFAWTPEYYYSAAVLRIDLTQLEQIEATEGLQGGTDYVDPYVYALPTLNDPTRPDNAQGQDTAAGTTGPADAEAADTFGGNDGRNQAKYDPDGPVQVYSPGYRNSYDLVITENNHIYTFDNGPNNGWGDVPLAADGVTPITSDSQIATNYPNIDVNTGSDTAPDNLHLVEAGFYGGHPNPVYASGAAAGLYWVDTSSGTPVVKQLTDPSDPNNDPTTTEDDLPVDWSEISGGFTDPEAGVYLSPGSNGDGSNKGSDRSLLTISSSSNGLAEYIAGKTTGAYPITDTSGAEVLVTVAFNGNAYLMEVVSDGTQTGTQVTDVEQILIGGTPLDVNDVADFAVGTEEYKESIFITQFGTDSLVALVPGVPTGPDTDQDDDGLSDAVDHFQYDPGNGTSIVLDGGDTLFWDFNPADSGINPGTGTEAAGPFNIGMTGWMTNGIDDLYLDPDNPDDASLTDLDNTIRGGAPGVIQIKSVTEGTSQGTTNTQRDAIQTGFLPASTVKDFTIKVPIYNPFTSDANTGVDAPTLEAGAFVGFALGDGSQSNYIQVGVGVQSGGAIQAQARYEEGDNTLAQVDVPADFLLDGTDNEPIELQLQVNMATYEAIASWNYLNNSVPGSMVIGTVQLDPNGQVVQALKGEYQNGGQASAAAVTLLATATGPSDPFTADFLDLTLESTTAATTDLALTKSVSKSNPSVGETVTFNLTVSNTSSTEATGVQIEDLLPAGFTYSSHQGDGSYDSATGIWTVGAVTSGQAQTLAIAAVVNEPGAIASPEVLYRVNVGGGTIASTDAAAPNWSADTSTNPSSYLVAGNSLTYNVGQASGFDLSDPSLPAGTPAALFQTERYDPATAPEIAWAFPLLPSSTAVEVRLYFAEIYGGITAPGQRVFDVAVEGSVPTVFDDVDPFAIAGVKGAFMLSHTLTVTDGELNLDFLHAIENPALKGIEIISGGGGSSSTADYTNYAQILTVDQIDSDRVAVNLIHRR